MGDTYVWTGAHTTPSLLGSAKYNLDDPLNWLNTTTNAVATHAPQAADTAVFTTSEQGLYPGGISDGSGGMLVTDAEFSPATLEIMPGAHVTFGSGVSPPTYFIGTLNIDAGGSLALVQSSMETGAANVAAGGTLDLSQAFWIGAPSNGPPGSGKSNAIRAASALGYPGPLNGVVQTLTLASGGRLVLGNAELGVVTFTDQNPAGTGGTSTNPAGVSGSGTMMAAAGTATVEVTTSGQLVPLASGSNMVFVTVPDTITQTGGANTIISATGAITLNASSGGDVVFDSAGNDLINEAPVSEFVGGPHGSASTINGAVGGSDTVFAENSVRYNGARAARSLFVGGTGVATVVAANNEIAFGGAGGGAYTVGGGSFFFVGSGAADTIAATNGSAAGFIWGHSGENLTVTSLAGAASVKGASLVAFGQAETINAQNAAGGNTWFIYNQIPTVAGLTTFSGDSTLIGSGAGGDSFNFFVDGTDPASHTITIENWRSSDTVFITNLGVPGGGLNATDSATIATFEAGSAQSFHLSDGTTLAFVGGKPTTVLHV